MALTYVKIASTTVVASGGVADVTFNSISASYDDLVIKISTRNTGNNAGLVVRLNGDTGGNYLYPIFYGTGASAASFNQGSFGGYNAFIFAYITPSTATASTFGNTEIYIPNYRGTTNKTVSIDSVSEDNSTGAYQSMTAGLWTNTAAITSVTIFADPLGNAANLAQNTTAVLYGISRT